MTIIFDSHDRDIVHDKLLEAGISIDAKRVNAVLDSVEAAFQQQLDYEAEYLINDIESDQ
jgi:hypothetical protein